MKNLQAFLVTLLIIGLLGAAIFLGFNWNKQNQTTVNVKLDKTVIVQKIQNIAKLETVEMTIQRDLSIELDAGGLSFFGTEVFNDKATTDYAVTGSVIAGIDLANLKQEQVSLENESKKLVITIPASQILAISINEDKTKITKQDFSALFNIKNLSPARRQEMQDNMQRQAIKQAKVALREGACSDNILDKASQNAKESIKNLFLFSDLEEVVVNITNASSCEFIGV
jgi:hypothetical protein